MSCSGSHNRLGIVPEFGVLSLYIYEIRRRWRNFVVFEMIFVTIDSLITLKRHYVIMPKNTVIAVLVGIIVAGSISPAWATYLDITIDPDDDSSPFSISYKNTVDIRYENGGNLSDELLEKKWVISGFADSSHHAVQDLKSKLNEKISSDGSRAVISNLNVTYEIKLNPRAHSSSIAYSVVFEGTLTDYVIAATSEKSLIDLGWRALSVDGPIVIDGIDINIPLNLIRSQEPQVFAHFVGTDAEEILSEPTINADFILEQPLTNWHFLFDPTGINMDAKNYEPDKGVEGHVRSLWMMGGSDHVQKTTIADIVSDQKYSVTTAKLQDSATLTVIGFGSLDKLDGIEIVRVFDSLSEGSRIITNDDFPTIIYGMAGLAAIAAIGVFIFRNRSLKNKKQNSRE